MSPTSYQTAPPRIYILAQDGRGVNDVILVVILELAMIGPIRVGFADPIRDRGAMCDSTKRHCVFEYMSPEQDGASNEPVP